MPAKVATALSRVESDRHCRGRLRVRTCGGGLESQQPIDPVFDGNHPRCGQCADVFRDVVAIQQWHAGGDCPGGDILRQFDAHSSASNQAGLGDPLLDLAADVGGIPRRTLCSQPRQHQLDGGSTVQGIRLRFGRVARTGGVAVAEVP